MKSPDLVFIDDPIRPDRPPLDPAIAERFANALVTDEAEKPSARRFRTLSVSSLPTMLVAPEEVLAREVTNYMDQPRWQPPQPLKLKGASRG